ncbi:MAG TPA: ATP-binding protein [Segetibacter sp.]
MNLKTRLATLYSLSVFIILLVSAVSILVLNENFRKEEFFKRLVLEAVEIHRIYTPDNVDEATKAVEFNSRNSLVEEKIFIYDSALQLRYAHPKAGASEIPVDFFSIAKQKQQHNFSLNGKEAVMLFRKKNNNSFYVVVSATDKYGHRKADNLKILSIFSVIGGLLLSGLLAFFYVRHVMKPLEELKAQIENINENNLQERVPIKSSNSEVWQIAAQFNNMLDRLEQSFEQRKNFVQHASHELRTPLTIMLAYTESALNKNLSAEEYKITLLSLKEDQQNLIDLTNSLLTLSRYQNATSADDDWSLVRIDEVLYQTVDFINQLWAKATVIIDFETLPEEENFLIVKGNESLLRAAIQNLLKNAIHYSEDYKVKVLIDANEKGITLKFENSGRILSPEEQKKLFIPFFRGENSMYKKGYGLGLSIVHRIISLHKGTVTYQAIEPGTNRFTMFLPKN